MQIADRKRQELAKRTGMFDDPEHGTGRAVAPKTAGAPFAVTASKVDFAGYPASDPLCAFVPGDRDHFANEFVTRRTGEAVISALEFQIRRTNPGGKQTDTGKAF